MNRFRHLFARISLFSDWYKLVFPINQLISRGQTLHLRNGILVAVGDIFSSDVSVLMEVFGQNIYPLDKFLLPVSPIVVDIGANIGAFSLAAKQHFPDAQIIAFEPSDRNCIVLRKNLPFAQIECLAVAGQSGEVHIQRKGAWTSFHLVKDLTKEEGIPAKALSLKEAIGSVSRVDLMKIDVEGAEYEILANASEDTLGKIKSFIVEVQHPERNGWYEALFTRLGLKCEWISDSNIIIATSDLKTPLK